jgi:hypothetical protein
MNVFSMMIAVICIEHSVSSHDTNGVPRKGRAGKAFAYSLRVAIGKVDRNGTSDRLAIKEL